MDNMERRQNEELLEARRLRRQEQKRRLLMRQRVLAVVLLVIVILSLILILRGCRNRREHPELYVKKDSALELQTEPDTTVNIAAVGDIMITDDLLADAKQPDGSYQFAESFAAVSGYTLSADFTIGNLECNFCGEPYAGKPDYRAPDSLATTLSTIGFDLLQTANTCSIQNGLSGLQSTIDTLTNAGIDHAGTYTSEAERTQNGGVVLKTVSGMKIAIVAYTKGLGGLQLPEGAEYAVNLLYKDYSTDYNKLDMSALLGSVDAAKSLKPDIILVMLHWGSEATLEPTKTQESIAKQLFERGADAIIGSHSHLVGRRRKGEDLLRGLQPRQFLLQPEQQLCQRLRGVSHSESAIHQKRRDRRNNADKCELYTVVPARQRQGCRRQPLRNSPHPYSHRLRPVPQGDRPPDKRHQPPAHKNRIGL